MNKIISKLVTASWAEYDLALTNELRTMVLLHLFDDSQTRLADFGYTQNANWKIWEV